MSMSRVLRSFFQQRRVLPTGGFDRLLLWGGMAGLLVYFAVRLWTDHHLLPWRYGAPEWILMTSGVVAAWLIVYLMQDRSKDEFEDYSAAIGDIENIGHQLAGLVDFLKRERQKVAESEATLRQLQNEKTKLEPVVLAQRETVNAILSAHAKTTALRLWKERAVGFLSGLVASLLASLMYEYLRRK